MSAAFNATAGARPQSLTPWAAPSVTPLLMWSHLAAFAVAAALIVAAAPSTGSAQTGAGQSGSGMDAPVAMSGHASADSAQALLNLIMTISRDEIAAGRLALRKSPSGPVRAYAQRLVDDHSAAMHAWAEKAPSVSLKLTDSAAVTTKPLAAMQGTAAVANGISEVRDTTTAKRGGMAGAAMHSAQLGTAADLEKATGAEFDQQFLKAQIDAQEIALNQLAEHPTTYTQLQTMLTDFRRMIEDHRIEARKLAPTG